MSTYCSQDQGPPHDSDQRRGGGGGAARPGVVADPHHDSAHRHCHFCRHQVLPRVRQRELGGRRVQDQVRLMTNLDSPSALVSQS